MDNETMCHTNKLSEVVVGQVKASTPGSNLGAEVLVRELSGAHASSMSLACQVRAFDLQAFSETLGPV